MAVPRVVHTVAVERNCTRTSQEHFCYCTYVQRASGARPATDLFHVVLSLSFLLHVGEGVGCGCAEKFCKIAFCFSWQILGWCS
jgi:hypothetical protein